MAESKDQQPPPLPSQKYAEADEYIDFQIRKTQTIVKRQDLITSCTSLLAFVLGYLLFFALLDQWVIPNGFPLVILWLRRLALLAISALYVPRRIAGPALM